MLKTHNWLPAQIISTAIIWHRNMINIHQDYWYQLTIPNPAKALRFEPKDRLQASTEAQH